MKIAIISDAIYPYNKGGKEKRIFEISTRLAKKGHDIHIYTMKWWKGGGIKKENGVTLHAICKLYPLYSGQRRSIKEAVFFALATLKLLNEQFDVIEADHMPHLVLFPLKLVSILKKKKFYVTWNEVWGRTYWVEYMGVMGNVAYLIEKVSARMADIIISISDLTTKRLQNELHFKKQIYTVPMGVNFEEIQRVKPSAKKSDVIYAGRLLSHKNIDVFIDAIAIIKKTNPNISCFIIGEGPEKKRLEEQVKNLKVGKNVLFLNFFENHNDLYAFMKSSKVFVLPSIREGFGIAALEANACGIPLLTTNHANNAAKYLINGKNGIVVPGGEKYLANAILSLLSKNVYRINITQFAKNYDWNTIASDIQKAYLQ